MRVFFVTSNKAKFREASLVLKEFGIDLLIDTNHRKVEIQSDNLEDIVSNALKEICNGNTGDYFVVEDDGLFINKLNGFPGPYSSYVYKTIGLTGILKLMSGVDDRTAYFKSVVGLCGPKAIIKLFTGVVYGNIAMEPRGSEGFGFDPIFIPSDYDKTFAELGIDIKNRLSHRAKAFRALGDWLLSIF
ncbi:RdgB/HAM1 family non-canonical purine NTP pyrophosphatase [Vulcanisaeta moutnovskia 768-28]|uniref:RdgB/HAM1 family non-canonical purine NTP pyrophosphatase n=1 Tax=Vulcanisaeta moutnovskia (strain 768-28) TaxID=985053 RepID=F0QUZ0_VULM7|nr:XTP/dITP diphosphatase [Vulcanisaeta moutnovskia]ADY01972.1 RdgB/HAM1 family non-canonical purine NTP pyrophosphatase [Vulcanisaeta moutnovskia 768-28]